MLAAPAQVKFVPLAQSLRVVLGFPRDSCLPQLERHRYPGIRTRGGIPTRRSVQVLRSVPTRRRVCMAGLSPSQAVTKLRC